jgi:hypothetical protein
MDCPIHGPQPDDADPFDSAVSAMIAIYLMSREVTPDYVDGANLVSIHAHLEDDPDIFHLEIGLGQAAHDAMDRKRLAMAEEDDSEPIPFQTITNAEVFGPLDALRADVDRWDADGGQ